MLAVVNPNSGPGNRADPAYARVIRRAQEGGVGVLGYVHTSYAARSAAHVLAEAGRYLDWYAVDGIFFDEASSDCAGRPYFAALHHAIKARDPALLTVLNPGTHPDECYMDAADLLVTFEGDFASYLREAAPPPWVRAFPAARFWHIVFGAPHAAAMRHVRALAADRHAGYLYVTDRTLPNPYSALPSYWGSELRAAGRLGYPMPLHRSMPEGAILGAPERVRGWTKRLSARTDARWPIAPSAQGRTGGVMSGQEQWQLSGSAPELYERYLVPAVTAVWAADLIAHAGLQAGERVLDVACGTGIAARLAAARVEGNGLQQGSLNSRSTRIVRVAGLDVNASMLALARTLPTSPGAAIAWLRGTVLALPFADAAFDVVLCQLGLQFFPERPIALGEMRRVTAPGGRLALNVYSAIARNPAPQALAEALDRHLAPSASAFKRAEHVLGDPEALHALVAGAGFRVVTIHTITKVLRFPSVRDWVSIQIAATPLATVVGQLQAERRTALLDSLVMDVGQALGPYVDERGLAFPQEGHVVLARR